MTVEKLLGIEIPKRVQYLRVIVMELARITDHLICNAVIGVDTGALTGFVYLFQQRELVYEIYEEICGARLTSNVFPAANWMERETYDFFGVIFEGHPNLIRILNVEEMIMFPLRKEFPLEDQVREDKNDSMFGR